MDILGFTTMRANRDTKACGKHKGGRHYLLLDQWNASSKSFPFYPPSEFSHTIIVHVYIPPRVDADTACNVILSLIARLGVDEVYSHCFTSVCQRVILKEGEDEMQKNNRKEIWDGMKTITSCKKKDCNIIHGDVVRANDLTRFFNRFDCPAPTTACPLLIACSLPLHLNHLPKSHISYLGPHPPTLLLIRSKKSIFFEALPQKGSWPR